MSLPEGVDTVRVYGRYVRLDGHPAEGTIQLAASTRLRYSPAGLAILPTTTEVDLDSNGEVEVELPATDDPNIEPTGWVYSVVERIGNGYRAYTLLAPRGSEIDLTAVRV